MNKLSLYAYDKPLVLSPNTRIRIRRVNPMFADGKIQGTFSFPFQLPKKPNMKLLGFVHDPQIADPVNEITKGVRLEYAGESMAGKLLILDAGTFYECQFLSENGQAANELQNKRLSELKFASDPFVLATGPGSENISRNLSRACTEGGWPKHKIVVYPFYNPNFFGGCPRFTGYFIANECQNETFDFVDYVRPKVTGFEGTPRRLTITGVTGEFINGESVNCTGGGTGQIATGVSTPGTVIISNPNGTFSGTLVGIKSGANADITTSNSAGTWPARYWQAPALFVFAVFEGIASELGYELLSDLLTDDELTSLTILTGRSLNRELEDVWGSGPVYPWFISLIDNSIYLKDYIPDWTVGEFLLEFKKLFGFISEFDSNKKEYHLYAARDILKQSADKDWTDKVERIYQKEVKQTESTHLNYSFDDNESLFPSKSIEGKNVIDNDITLPADRKVGDLVLEGGFWKEYWRDQFFNLSVNTFSFDYGEILTPGRVRVEQISRFTIMPTDTLNPLSVRMPRFGVKGNVEGFDTGIGNSVVPRLVFYRGLAEIGSSVLGDLYPYASTDSNNHEASDVFNYSLKFDGDKGIYATFLVEYIAFLSRTTLTKRRLLLKSGNIFSIDMKRRKIIDGTQYYIKHIDVTLPITGMAEAELYQF